MPDRGLLLRRETSGWLETNLGACIPDLDLSIAKSSAISCDPNGNVHLLISTDPLSRASGWYDPSFELFHLVFGRDGNLVERRQLTPSVNGSARWLPALEHCDWLRPGTGGRGGFWSLYTSGRNAGLMSQDDYDDTLANDVYLMKIPV